MLRKWNKSFIYCRVLVFLVSQRSNMAQMTVKLLFDIQSKNQKSKKFWGAFSIDIWLSCFFTKKNNNSLTGWCSPVQFVCVIIVLNWIFICEIFWKLLPQKNQKQGLRADSTSLWSMALIGGRPQSQAQQQSQQISHSQCQPTSVDGLADNSLYASSWQISHKEHCLAVLVCPQLLCSCRPLCNPERDLTVVLWATVVTLADFLFFIFNIKRPQ